MKGHFSLDLVEWAAVSCFVSPVKDGVLQNWRDADAEMTPSEPSDLVSSSEALSESSSSVRLFNRDAEFEADDPILPCSNNTPEPEEDNNRIEDSDEDEDENPSSPTCKRMRFFEELLVDC